MSGKYFLITYFRESFTSSIKASYWLAQKIKPSHWLVYSHIYSPRLIYSPWIHLTFCIAKYIGVSEYLDCQEKVSRWMRPWQLN